MEGKKEKEKEKYLEGKRGMERENEGKKERRKEGMKKGKRE